MLLLFLFLMWIVLLGGISAEILLTGALAAGAVWFLTLRALRLSPGWDFRLFLRLPRIAVFLFLLWKEVLLSALRVMRLIWSPRRPVSAEAEFDPEISTLPGRVLLADAITLTPGTITVEAGEDRFLVHCLEKTAAGSLPPARITRMIQRLEGSRS